ncbi:MAG: Sulfite reductase [ferredoxin] [Alphaproteobacteria bacterium MarineAlpha10_Bin3]|nr:MAG: Sulfite reductase [ferredoxin] [Alphaproteobacteria bacterium MarineAlpha10_Bin3]PPR66974.1 MAG: Sulfite reductase [ferredoxin] [Alphaproteobacteria bacterium MarineAlpha4_Bin1]
MYRYDRFDAQLVNERVAQFRDQVRRRLSGALSEEEFRPLRLLNGLYLQLHAYMLRVAIPYGTLSADQMRMLASIARRYDRGYGHFTTRQNIQFNWTRLQDAPDILADLASVEMHAIQTSGNTIRNTTADPFAGVAANEIEDPRIYCEAIRQWSTLHPEFTFLPRKFKIAVTGAPDDRAAIKVHDIGLALRRDADGAVGFEVMVGGGQGRTPMIAKTIRAFLPKRHLLSYLEAILRVYNLGGRRDNKYKARIKILVHDRGVDAFRADVEAEWARIRKAGPDLDEAELSRIAAHFAPPAYDDELRNPRAYADKLRADGKFAGWTRASVAAHRRNGYAIVTVSLKPEGGVPGDATAVQMDCIADLAARFSFGEIRITHEQNLVLAHVRQSDLFDLWRGLRAHGLATANVGLIGDIIACPGMDFCGLATTRSIPVAQQISTLFADLERQHDIGELRLKISGCINACGHHHVGHIGILGVDRKGAEFYQITLGGRADENAAIGKFIGRAFAADAVVGAVETIVNLYIARRQKDERFIDAYERLGPAPFKEALYGTG